MLILGLSSLKHDTAAALFEDGIIKAAIEEDKLTRSRSKGFPENAIQFCLGSAGATWSDLDGIAIATRPFDGWLADSLSLVGAVGLLLSDGRGLSPNQ